jgi:hypothetical protein
LILAHGTVRVFKIEVVDEVVLSAHGLREVVGDVDRLARFSHGGHVDVATKILGVGYYVYSKACAKVGTGDRRFICGSRLWWVMRKKKRSKRGVNIYHLASHDARTTVRTERDDPSSPHMAKDRPMNIGSKKGPTHTNRGLEAIFRVLLYPL